MNGDCRVAQHRFGTCRGDDDVLLRAGYGITDMPQMALLLFVDDFEIRQRRKCSRVPVDQILSAIDESFFVEAHKGFSYGARRARIHGEALAGPIAACPDALELPDDATSVFLLPGPHVLEELLSTDLAAIDALFAKVSLDQHLGRDACMVGAGKPQHVVALHAPPSHRDVGQRNFVHVADVQCAGNVGRGRHQTVGGLIAIVVGDKKLVFDPRLSPTRLDLPGFVNLFDFHGTGQGSVYE